MVSHVYFDTPRKLNADGRDGQKGSYLGPEFKMPEIFAFLQRNDYPYEHIADGAERSKRIAEALAGGKTVDDIF